MRLQDALPYNDYFEYYGPEYRLHMPVSNMENLNTPDYLDRVKVQLFDILKSAEPVPGVQIETGNVTMTAPDIEVPEKDEDKQNPDERPGAHRGLLPAAASDALNRRGGGGSQSTSHSSFLLPYVFGRCHRNIAEGKEKEHPAEFLPTAAPAGMDTA